MKDDLYISVIVSTYNRLDALNSVLEGLAAQINTTGVRWEIIVADDGSDVQTAELTANWRTKLPCPLHHVWHEDRGFRLAAIRNKSAYHAKGNYLIFLDGDCIPFPDFLMQSIKIAEPGWFAAGNRILLDRNTTIAITHGAKNPISWSKLFWFYAKITKKSNRALPWLRLNINNIRKRRSTNWKILKGCNIGVWRKDFISINGFDESFSGWGHEDSDFAIRLIRSGIKLKDGRFAIPVIHLWHKENDRAKQAENWKRLEQTLLSNHIYASQGIEQYKVLEDKEPS